MTSASALWRAMALRISARSFSLSQGFWTKFSAPGADGVDDVVDGAEGGDHDNRQLRVHGGDAREEIDAGFAGQGEVEEEQVELVAREDVEALFAVDGEGDVEAFEGEKDFEGLADGGLVIDDEEAGGGAGGLGGRGSWGERFWHQGWVLGECCAERRTRTRETRRTKGTRAWTVWNLCLSLIMNVMRHLPGLLREPG